MSTASFLAAVPGPVAGDVFADEASVFGVGCVGATFAFEAVVSSELAAFGLLFALFGSGSELAVVFGFLRSGFGVVAVVACGASRVGDFGACHRASLVREVPVAVVAGVVPGSVSHGGPPSKHGGME